jgi:hypothetical protein
MTPGQDQLAGLEKTLLAVCSAASLGNAFRAALVADEDLVGRLASAIVELRLFMQPPSQAEDSTVSLLVAGTVAGSP